MGYRKDNMQRPMPVKKNRDYLVMVSVKEEKK